MTRSAPIRFVQVWLAVLGIASSVPVTVAIAQCRPPKGSNEASLLAFYSAPVAFASDLAAPEPGGRYVRVALEAAPMPTPSARLRRTGVCFTQKSEHTDLTPVFARPRLSVGVGAGLVAELSYLPPLPIGSATPNLTGVALSRVTRVRRGVVTVRVHGAFGSVRGPITCPRKALQMTDDTAPCYGTEESDDTFRPRVLGGELTAGTSAGERWFLSGSVGASSYRPRFEVGFTDALDRPDRTRIEPAAMRRVSLAGGGSYRFNSRCGAGGQVYASLGDLAMVRMFVGCRVR